MNAYQLPRLTHGRHCRCTPCANEDWTNPRLAHCGMHGPSCPALYDPYDRKEYETRRANQDASSEGLLRRALAINLRVPLGEVDDWARRLVEADERVPVPWLSSEPKP